MQAAKPISRREMLYYLAGGAALLAAGASGAGALWYLQTTPRIGEDWLAVPLSDIPTRIADPVRFSYSHAYFALVEGGLLALSDVCPFDRHNVRWSRHEQRFMCPACGSQYVRDGAWLAGPSDFHLNRYVMRVQCAGSAPWSWTITPTDGAPIDVTNATTVYIDTTQSIARAHGGEYVYACEHTDTHITCRDT